MTDDEDIFLCAFRYCLGRRSYIVNQCVRWVRSRWIELGEDCHRVIERDLRERLTRDVGMTVDRDVWRDLLTFIEEQKR